MLLQALCFTVFFLTLGAYVAADSIVLAKIALHATALQLLADGSDRGERYLTKQLAREVAALPADAGYGDLTAPATTNESALPCTPSDKVFCTATLTTHFTLLGKVGGAEQPSDQNAACIGVAGNNRRTACNVQKGGALNEDRLGVAIDVTLFDVTGAVLARQQRKVTLRLIKASPFVLATGSFDAGTTNGIETAGDSGGMTPRADDVAIPDPLHPERYHDTRIRSYQPCRLVPVTSTISPSDGQIWGTWQGNDRQPAREVACDEDAGETSHYAQEQWDNEKPNSWSD